MEHIVLDDLWLISEAEDFAIYSRHGLAETALPDA
jgi:hypothetical protein